MTPVTTISVAIPLHASAPWVSNVLANVAALPPTVTEILISDRTLIDDSAMVLGLALTHDPRVTVVACADGLSWPEHCQLLLETATGEFFAFMPHDDVFPLNWIPLLSDALLVHPEALLAYGRVDAVLSDGVTPRPHWYPRPMNSGLVTSRTAMGLLGDQLWFAFRGLIRRQAVLDAELRIAPLIPYPWDGYLAYDELWILSIALHHPIVYVDEAVTLKRFTNAGASSQSPRLPPSPFRDALLRTIGQHCVDRRERLILGIYAWQHWAMAAPRSHLARLTLVRRLGHWYLARRSRA